MAFNRLVEFLQPRIQDHFDVNDDIDLNLELLFDSVPSDCTMLAFNQVLDDAVMFHVGRFDSNDWVPVKVSGEIPIYTVFRVLNNQSDHVFEGSFTLNETVVFDSVSSAAGLTLMNEGILPVNEQKFTDFVVDFVETENYFKSVSEKYELAIQYLPFDDDESERNAKSVWCELLQSEIQEVQILELDTENKTEQKIATDMRVYRLNYMSDLDNFDTIKDDGKYFNIVSLKPENPSDPFHFQIAETEGKLFGDPQGVLNNWHGNN